MRIKSLALRNIKKFNFLQRYDFAKGELVNTVSGKNGSGKSTIFECIMLCQKAYFVKKMSSEDATLLNDVSKDLYGVIVGNEAYIDLGVQFIKQDFHWSVNANKYHSTKDEDNDDVYDVHVILKVRRGQNNSILWDVDVDENGNEGLLSEFWNLKNPSHVIVYLDADKNVYEDDFTYQKITMISDDEINPIVKFVIQPKQLYQNMYNVMMNAYVYQRINPQTPKKDQFFSESKEMFHELISEISVSNFSGKEYKDQFVLVAKNKEKYDARNFSSGEKLIWYTLLVLNYVKKIGVFIVDEPENHLHEELAWKFINFLKEVMRSKKSELKIGQVFLITHAKNIIYNNFADGKNYIIGRTGNLSLVEKDKCEDILRECGISYIDDKVLFVEGKTDSKNLARLCERDNIRIRELANCAEIIQVYKSLVKVKELVYVPKFVFIIDKDTRGDEEIESIRSLDTSFFEKHFVVLPVHEFENFFLNEAVIGKVVNDFLMHVKEKPKGECEILEIMKRHAEDSLEDTKRKYLNGAIREEIRTLEKLVKQRNIDISSQRSYEEYIDGLLTGDEYECVIGKMKQEYFKMTEKYGMVNWLANWKKICDGKRVYNQTINELAGQIGLMPNKLEKLVVDKFIDDSSSDIGVFWNGVVGKLR